MLKVLICLFIKKITNLKLFVCIYLLIYLLLSYSIYRYINSSMMYKFIRIKVVLISRKIDLLIIEIKYFIRIKTIFS